MSDFLPALGSTVIIIPAFIVALSIIVAIHEYGHYIVGRWTGIHAEVFSLGFGKVLVSRVDRHGTRWQIAAIPLGGYVKFLGDANAASVGGTDGGRHTMMGAPLWARALTVLAGPVANFILAFVIFVGLAFYVGKTADPLTLASVPDFPPGNEQELQAGDGILAVEGLDASTISEFATALEDLPVQAALTYTILRDGEELQVKGPYPNATIVQSVVPMSAADDAGVLVDDVITAMNGQPVFAFQQMVEIVSASDGQPILLDIWRDGAMVQITLSPRRTDLPTADGGFETDWKMGVSAGIFFTAQTVTPSVWEAVKSGVLGTWGSITTTVNAIHYMIAGKISTCNLSSPVGIANVMGDAAEKGLDEYIARLALLSAGIGLFNLFPIPVLDGGHLVFHAYEAVTRRKPSDGAMRLLIAVGLSIILTLTLFGVMNDLFLCR